MNPLDLRGPEFLLFYLVFGTVVLVLIRWLIRSGEPGTQGVTPVVADRNLCHGCLRRQTAGVHQENTPV